MSAFTLKNFINLRILSTINQIIIANFITFLIKMLLVILLRILSFWEKMEIIAFILLDYCLVFTRPFIHFKKIFTLNCLFIYFLFITEKFEFLFYGLNSLLFMLSKLILFGNQLLLLFQALVYQQALLQFSIFSWRIIGIWILRILLSHSFIIFSFFYYQIFRFSFNHLIILHFLQFR